MPPSAAAGSSSGPRPRVDDDVDTVVLWDVDGTLVRSGRTAGDLYHLALERTVGRDLERLVGHQHGRTDAGSIVEHLRAHELDPGLSQTVSGHLQVLAAERQRAGVRRSPAPGVLTVIERMRELRWRCGLLTGNSPYRARSKLESAGLDVDAFDWDHAWFGDADVERSALTRRAADALRGCRVVVVGDTPRDAEAAHAAGIPFVGVATGVHDLATLRATAAVAVVPDCAVGADDLIDAIAALPPLR